MQSKWLIYLKIPLTQFSELFVDLSAGLRKGDVISDVRVDVISGRKLDPAREERLHSSSAIRYAIPAKTGVIIGFEPWAAGKVIRISGTTAQKRKFLYYYQIVNSNKMGDGVEWSKVLSGLENIPKY